MDPPFSSQQSQSQQHQNDIRRFAQDPRHHGPPGPIQYPHGQFIPNQMFQGSQQFTQNNYGYYGDPPGHPQQEHPSHPNLPGPPIQQPYPQQHYQGQGQQPPQWQLYPPSPSVHSSQNDTRSSAVAKTETTLDAGDLDHSIKPRGPGSSSSSIKNTEFSTGELVQSQHSYQPGAVVISREEHMSLIQTIQQLQQAVYHKNHMQHHQHQQHQQHQQNQYYHQMGYPNHYPAQAYHPGHPGGYFNPNQPPPYPSSQQSSFQHLNQSFESAMGSQKGQESYHTQKVENLIKQLYSMPGGSQAAEQLLSQTPREELNQSKVSSSLDCSKQKIKKSGTDTKLSVSSATSNKELTPIQIFVEHLKKKHNLENTDHLQNYDELYYEKIDGQILIQRNPVNLQFEFLLFVDISNIFKEKKQKAIHLAQIYDNLNHPNLLNLTQKHILLDSQLSDTSLILFQMEAPDHIQNWKSFCKRPFSPITTLLIFRQLCHAVAYLHNQGLIHRDIHPTRISSKDNIIKLNLVGMPYNYKKLLKNENFCGHLNYSPPEALVDGCENITEKADVWALGCCLYFLTYKKDPFESNNQEQIKQNIRNLSLEELNTEKSKNEKVLDDLIKICLHIDLNERPTAVQLIQCIDNIEAECFGQVETQETMINLTQMHQQEYFTVKYPKNPNQAKVNPEFFSKKVGEKLMKIQNLDEMLNISNSETIKKKKLTAEQKVKLYKEWEALMGKGIVSQNVVLEGYKDPSEEKEALAFQALQEEKQKQLVEKIQQEQKQKAQEKQQNEARIKEYERFQQNQFIENKIKAKYGAFGELKVIEQESQAESSSGAISTFSTKHQKKLIEQQLYDLISDKSKVMNLSEFEKNQIGSNNSMSTISQFNQSQIIGQSTNNVQLITSDNAHSETLKVSQTTSQKLLENLLDNIDSNQNSSESKISQLTTKSKQALERKSEQLHENKMNPKASVSNTQKPNQKTLIVNFVGVNKTKLKGKNNGQYTPNIESEQVNLSSSQKQQFENRSYDPDNMNQKISKVSIQNSDISGQEFVSDYSGGKQIDLKMRHEFRKMITDSLNNIKQKTHQPKPSFDTTQLDTNLTTAQQKLNEKIYQKKMSISVRNGRAIRSHDGQIEKVPKIKRSSSAPKSHTHLGAEILNKVKIRPDERQNFKQKMLQTRKSVSKNTKSAPQNLSPIEESNEEDRKDDPPIRLQDLMRSAGTFQIFKSENNSEDPVSSIDDDRQLKKGIISYILGLQNKQQKKEESQLEEKHNQLEKKTDSHKGGSYMSDGGSNKESNKSQMRKNKKLAATRGRKNFNEFYDQRDTESQEAGAMNTSNMQVKKINEIVTADNQVNEKSHLIKTKTPSIYSVTTFGIQQSSGKMAIDSGSHTGMSSGQSKSNSKDNSKDIASNNTKKNSNSKDNGECVIFSDGSKFFGKVMKVGYGVFYYPNGDIYRGNWHEDQRQGFGEMQWQNGDSYEGNWEDDKMKGKGAHLSASGDRYTGNFVNGQKSNNGVMEYSNKDKYEGEWKEDMIWSTNGQFWFANGNHYIGNIQKGLFQGEGCLTIVDQGTYTGCFAEGSINGEGRFEYFDGSQYQGGWKDCKMHGKGKLTQADGLTVYEGQFQKGLKHGIGTLTKLNENKIKGIWQKDELDNMITYENLKVLSQLNKQEQ